MAEHITDVTSAADFADQNEEYVDDWTNLGAGGGPRTRAMAREEEEKAKRGKTKIKNYNDDRINMYGLEEISMSTDENVLLDGNTQFCALAKLMLDTEMAHTYVRGKTTRELVEHPEIYERAFRKIYGEASYEDYCETVSQAGNEGDFVSLQGASNAFQVKILLVCTVQNNFILEFIPENHKFKKEFIMGCFSNGDYNIYKAIYDPRERRSTQP